MVFYAYFILGFSFFKKEEKEEKEITIFFQFE